MYKVNKRPKLIIDMRDEIKKAKREELRWKLEDIIASHETESELINNGFQRPKHKAYIACEEDNGGYIV